MGHGQSASFSMHACSRVWFVGGFGRGFEVGVMGGGWQVAVPGAGLERAVCGRGRGVLLGA